MNKSYISVWSEYDVRGQFGGGNEEIFLVDDELTNSEVEALLNQKYSDLWGEVKEEDDPEDASLFTLGLMGWERTTVEELS
jgi:hypothetical protein